LAFEDTINSIGFRQHVLGPTHCRNSYSRSNIITWNIPLKYCSRAMTSQITIKSHKLHLVKAAKPSLCYKYVRPITSATKDCFINNLLNQFHHLSILDSLEVLDVVTETLNSLFSSTLDILSSLKED